MSRSDRLGCSATSVVPADPRGLRPRSHRGGGCATIPAVEPSESIIELILRVGSGVTAVVGLVFTALAAVWVVSSPDSDGSWIPVLPWAAITLIAIVLFAVLLARLKARHAAG